MTIDELKAYGANTAEGLQRCMNNGSTGNLSLTPIFAPVCEITELLRARTQTDYTALVSRIRVARDDLARICED